MNIKQLILISGCTLLVACTTQTTTPAPPPTIQSAPPTQAFPTLTAFPTPTLAPTDSPIVLSPTPTLAPVSPAFCADHQATDVIDALQTAVLTEDGALLSTLVHPTRGMDVRYFRDGAVINYTADQAKFLFETTFEANWGNAPGSGEEKRGSFHDVIIPSLVDLFSFPYTLHCNELKHGGATYELVFPSDDTFYSIYFPGTDANGQLDWQTWAVGMDEVNSKLFIVSLTQFFWEP